MFGNICGGRALNDFVLLCHIELCNQYGADPLNIALLIEQSATLTAQGATECSPTLLAAEGGIGLGPCLEQLGLFGYEVIGRATATAFALSYNSYNSQ